MRTVLIAAITGVVVAASQAAEKPIELKPGAGRDKVVANCNGCHSLDYIPMNGQFLDVAGWDAEVAKMISAFGAPIDQANAKQISDYLRTNYGSSPQTAAPAAAGAKSQLQRYRLGGIRPKAPAPKPPRRDPSSALGAVDDPDTADHGVRAGRE